jgi:hypothetical protein
MIGQLDGSDIAESLFKTYPVGQNPFEDVDGVFLCYDISSEQSWEVNTMLSIRTLLPPILEFG